MTNEGYTTPGRSKVIYVVTVTTPTAPTEIEINAGADLTKALRGLPDVPRSATTADASDLSSKFDKQVGATVGGDTGQMEFKRRLTTETEYGAFDEGDAGYLAIFRKGLSNGVTVSVGDVCDFYPIEILTKAPVAAGRTDIDTSIVTFSITDDPLMDYSVIST